MFRSRHSSPLVAQTGTKGEKMTGPGQLELLDPGVETDAPHSAWSRATRQVVRLFGLSFATLPGDRVRGPGIPDPPRLRAATLSPEVPSGSWRTHR
jgi:hypothetical protein